MAPMKVSLPDPVEAWVETQAKSRRHGSASDYARHLIRRDQDRQRPVPKLQKPVDEGLASGPAEPNNDESFLTSMRAAYARYSGCVQSGHLGDRIEDETVWL